MTEHEATPNSKLGLVLVACDDSKASLDLMDFVAKHFGADHEILLTHVHCKDTFPTEGAGSVFYVQDVRESLDKEAEKREYLFMKKVLLPRLEAAGVKARAEALSINEMGNSAIAAALCKRAEKLHPEFLVLSKHSKKAITAFFVGSVTKDCLRHASCPVVVV